MRSCDVEEFVLLGDVEIQGGTGQPRGPRRGAAQGFGPDGADQGSAASGRTGAGPTGSTESVTFSAFQTRFITATRSAI